MSKANSALAQAREMMSNDGHCIVSISRTCLATLVAEIDRLRAAKKRALKGGDKWPEDLDPRDAE